MNGQNPAKESAGARPALGAVWRAQPGVHAAVLAALTLLIVAAFWHSFVDIYNSWNMPESLYSHAIIIPPISLFFVWRLRARLGAVPADPCPALGMPVLLGGCGLLLLGDFLGFMTLVHLALLPVLLGLAITFLGLRGAAVLWFPLAFVIFMIPMPYSLLQVVSFKSKMIATESAVAIGQMMTLNLVQDGSFVYLGADDRLLVGDVCGGMRSLIALLAFGALMAFISKTRWWARILILLVSPLVAIIANVARILFLCIVGYTWGSASATGIVHDASGIGIFAVAFVLLFSVESFLRRIAPVDEAEGQPAENAPETAPPPGAPARWVSLYATGIAILVCVSAAHWMINIKRDRAALAAPRYANLDLPHQIGPYAKVGEDIDPGDDVRRALETSSILMRYYVDQSRVPVLLTIVYTGEKRRSLHFPEQCFVGQGWEVEQAYSAPVGIEFEARRLVIFRGAQKEAVLYWLKTGDRFTSSAFMNAVFWAREQLMFGTPTSALVRLSVPIQPGQRAEEAFAALDDFATRLGPILLENIE
ncbi:MAG: EpsI family protein [Candidatus Hydrogenedentes bacterium]|nr:EpsI family protein [Candidatus Hydrogenedentota bacterium]